LLRLLMGVLSMVTGQPEQRTSEIATLIEARD
jgi:hypothetical protein